MKRIRIAVHLTLVLSVAMAVVAFFVPTDAKANCFYPTKFITNYYGYHWGPGDDRCYWPNISPVPPKGLVGQEIRECDGSLTSWGIVCDDATSTTEWCEPICD